MNTSDKLLTLDNIRRQFRQDCTISFKNCVFVADMTTLMSITAGEAIDKDGFPVPLFGDDIGQLQSRLREAWTKARKDYFERMGKLGLDKLTEVKTTEDEETE